MSAQFCNALTSPLVFVNQPGPMDWHLLPVSIASNYYFTPFWVAILVIKFHLDTVKYPSTMTKKYIKKNTI